MKDMLDIAASGYVCIRRQQTESLRFSQITIFQGDRQLTGYIANITRVYLSSLRHVRERISRPSLIMGSHVKNLKMGIRFTYGCKQI